MPHAILTAGGIIIPSQVFICGAGCVIAAADTLSGDFRELYWLLIS
jgi:hypothetical protein